MRSAWTDDDLAARIAQWQPASEQEHVRTLLASYGGGVHHREPQRVRRVLLQSSNGSLDRLRMLVDMAKTDYRDVLTRDPGPDA